MEATQTEQKRVPASVNTPKPKMAPAKQESRSVDQNQPTTPKIKKFLSVKSFSEEHPEFSQASLRWMIFNRESNGFASVFRKVGRRVLIDELAFFEKIESSTMEA